MYQNKSVALICPAPHIERIHQRDYINKFDVIVRVNRSLPIPDKIKRNTSARCNVLYIARNIDPVDEWDSVQEIRVQANALWEQEKLSDEDNNTMIPVFYKDKLCKYKNKITLIHPSCYYDIINTCGFVPNIGLQAIIDIIKEKPSLLYITGMTFYRETRSNIVRSPFYEGYENPYHKKVVKNKGDIWGHDQDKQLKYFYNFYLNYSNIIKIDNKLKQTLDDYGKEKKKEGDFGCGK